PCRAGSPSARTAWSGPSESGSSFPGSGPAGRLMLERTQVLVLGLGGTISMRDASGAGAQPSLYLAEVLDGLPGELNVDLEDLKLVPGAALVFHDVLQVADRIRRAGAEGYVGAVVVQGTDTLEEVAYA